jgi:hypothetical protein
VAVTQGNTGQVPEDQHEAPFLVVHIPVNLLDLNRTYKGTAALTRSK